jgi:hypothetical protein
VDEVMRGVAEQAQRTLATTDGGMRKILDQATATAARTYAGVFAEVYCDGVQRRWDEFEQAMREESVPDETVRRVMNRVQTGHPDGLAGIADDLKGGGRG